MSEKKAHNSGRYPRRLEADSFGHRLGCVLDELVRQGHEREASDMLDPIVSSLLNLLDDNTVSTEIKALASDCLRTYGEDWTVRFDDRTQTRIKELLGE